ncbi:fungal specific transcription factor domain-containing protein [Aspergillus affinis]|uniref:fungal specific transcription factor domain-containing protein n=1 Tax=Aspergillus affinis TaxID=1070780 RepID=UPI0022FE9D84|nr:fungal-specific transcription factor domain-containing protein [Aspergillus affinis]KAI9042355.1 fungal-specific transcription factor domain-containing protein [Aspergillus affinis]
MHKWLGTVPDALKTKRKDGTAAFATENVSLDIERFAPEWLQRQRVLLELLYHNLSMNLCRPLICFPTSKATTTSNADTLAAKSVHHVMAFTAIMYQMLIETQPLNGWHEAFQWQWNAALSMVGFALAYPFCPITSTVRDAIDIAIAVFEIMGKSFAVAASAVNVTRDVTAKADLLVHRAHGGNTTARVLSPPEDHSPGAAQGAQSAGLSFAGLDAQDLPAGLDDSMGLAFTADSFTSFEPVYAGNLFDMWIVPELDFDGL